MVLILTNPPHAKKLRSDLVPTAEGPNLEIDCDFRHREKVRYEGFFPPPPSLKALRLTRTEIGGTMAAVFRGQKGDPGLA
jgi:hypothetical protein